MISTSLLLLLLAAVHCVHCVELIQTRSTVLTPGQSLTLTCTVSGYSITSHCTAWIRQPTGKALAWIGYICSSGDTYYSEKLKSRFQISRDTSKNTVTLTGQNMQTEDTAVYYCARFYNWGYYGYFDYWGKGTQVTVTSAVQGPPQSLFPVWQCGEPKNNQVTLGCVTHDLAIAEGVTFLWEDASGTQLTGNAVQYPAVQASKGYTAVSHLNVKSSDWDANKSFKCIVKNDKGSKEAELRRPTPPPELPANLILTTPTQKEIENGTATFICLASEFSPKDHTFKWSLDDKDISSKAKHTLISQGKHNFTALSLLELSANQWTGSSSEVSCEFMRKNHKGQKKSAKYVGGEGEDVKVTIIEPSTDILIDRVGRLKCETKKDGTFVGIKWLDANENPIAHEEESGSGDSMIRISIPISFEEWSNGTEFTCEVANKFLPEGSKRKTFQRSSEDYCLIWTKYFHKEMSTEEDDNMAKTAMTFVFLFLVSLFYSIGVTVIKVK